MLKYRKSDRREVKCLNEILNQEKSIYYVSNYITLRLFCQSFFLLYKNNPESICFRGIVSLFLFNIFFIRFPKILKPHETTASMILFSFPIIS